ncbi:hypothetical protein D3C75_842540 [compost metagenome]
MRDAKVGKTADGKQFVFNLLALDKGSFTLPADQHSVLDQIGDGFPDGDAAHVIQLAKFGLGRDLLIRLIYTLFDIGQDTLPYRGIEQLV